MSEQERHSDACSPANAVAGIPVYPLPDEWTIHYLIPHAPSSPEEASPFQFFAPGILDTAAAFHVIATLPRNAAELCFDANAFVAARIAGGGYFALPLPTTLISRAIQHLAGSIIVVLSMNDAIAATVAAIVSELDILVLHATPSQRPTRAAIRDHCLRVAESWTMCAGKESLGKALTNELCNWQDAIVETELAFEGFTHLVTAPNLAILAAAGYRPRPGKNPLISAENEPYYSAIKSSVDAICDIRHSITKQNPRLHARAPTDLILTLPGVRKAWREILRSKQLRSNSAENQILRPLLRQLVARETYSLNMEAESLERVMSSPVAKAILHSSLEDIEAYTATLSLRGSANFAPVIRLPLSPNLGNQELTNLTNAIRHDRGMSTHKINRLAKTVSQRLSAGLPPWVFQQIRDSRRVKLISDAPLEWMDIDGFPLMLRADVSRIAVTPGNLFVQQAILGPEVVIPLEMFKEVLVIRSFQPGDQIKPLLEQAIAVYAKKADNFPAIRIVDVRTRKEFEDALNSFKGALLVYDGHGAHPTESDVGYLALSDEKVDPWTLRGNARIPPIVMLAACDTHPLDGSHATSANGFLAAGAMTVIATGMPVGGKETAMFVARLLLRVGEYLPLLIRHRPFHSFRWSEIVPGLQRRQYTTEALRRLALVGGVSLRDEQFVNIMMNVGMAIDGGGDWLRLLVTEIQNITGWSTERTIRELSRQAAYVNAMAFIQLGNPEQVVGCEMREPGGQGTPET